MRALTPTLRRVIVVIITLLVLPVGILAQDTGDSEQEYTFSREELAQMLAPIALYPDTLTAQVLMASTYPLEVVEADRWRSLNLHLKGDDLDAVLKDKNWDPSIKSLCHFPGILNSLSDKLDQTRKLGDAFLSQEKEVMATIQELRGKARDQGNLKTTNEQKIIVEKEIIRIEPANPEAVYVPVYNPSYVYGPWWYPAYPPNYWYYPPGFYNSAYIGFGPGIYFGLHAFSWAWFDWPVHRVRIDINKTRNFHHIRGREYPGGHEWRHNPQHRKGVAYRDLRTSERFGSGHPRASMPPGRERRGVSAERIEHQMERPARPTQREMRQGVSPSNQSNQSPQTPQLRRTPATGTADPGIRRENRGSPREQFGSDKPQRPVVRDTPLSGTDAGYFERKVWESGSRSNFDNEMRRQSGGSSDGRMHQRQDDGNVPDGGGSRGGGHGGGSRRGR